MHNQLSQQFIGHEFRSQSVYHGIPKHTFILWVQLAYWDDSKSPGKIAPISVSPNRYIYLYLADICLFLDSHRNLR